MQAVYVGYDGIVPFGAIGEADGTSENFTFIYRDTEYTQNDFDITDMFLFTSVQCFIELCDNTLSEYKLYADSIDRCVQTIPSQYIQAVLNEDKIILKTKNTDYHLGNPNEELYVVLGKRGHSRVHQDLKNFLRCALYEMSKNGDIIKG